MPIPIAKEQEQFKAPTAAAPSGNASRVLSIDTGLPQAVENVTKAAFSAHDVLAKMRVESDSAKASNDFLAYKKEMNDLLYSNQLDDNGNPVGFIYQTGENAFKALKDYDAKASALYQEFTKKLGNYLPVATENAFKSANAYNETFRETLMKHAAQENEKFQEESLSAYVADTIANVDAGLLAYNDNPIVFYESASTELSGRIMQYYTQKGFPQKGKELYQKKNADLLEATLQQVALNASTNLSSPFSAYNQGDALLKYVQKQNGLKGTEVVPTKKINDLGKMFATRQFEYAFIHPAFNPNEFFPKLTKSPWLDGLDKIKQMTEYTERFKKSRDKGLSEQVDQIDGFLFQVKNGVYIEKDKDGMVKDFSSNSFKYLPEFFANLSNPNTQISEITDDKGNKEYSVTFYNKDYQQEVERISKEDKSTKNLFNFFIKKFAEGDWVIPSATEAAKISKLALSYYPGSQSAEGVANQRFLQEQNQNAKMFSQESDRITSRTSTTTSKNGKVEVNSVINAKDVNDLQQNMVNMTEAHNKGALKDEDYNKLMASDRIASRNYNLDTLDYNDRIVATGFFDVNWLGIPNGWRKIQEMRENARIYSETTGRGTSLGTFLTDYFPVIGGLLSPREDKVNYESEVDTVRRTNMQTLNSVIEGRQIWEDKLVDGNFQNQSKVLMNVLVQDMNSLVRDGRLFFKDALNSSKYTVFAGALTQEDINEIKNGFYAHIRSENGWNDPNKTDYYMKQIDKNKEEYIAKWHQYMGNWLVEYKGNSIYTSVDGSNFAKVSSSDIVDNSMSVTDNLGNNYPISIQAIPETTKVQVDRQGLESGSGFDALSRSKDFPVLRGPRTITVPLSPQKRLEKGASSSPTDKDLQEKVKKEAKKQEDIFNANRMTSVEGSGRRVR